MVEKYGHEVVGIIGEPGVSGRLLNELDTKREIFQIPGTDRIGVLNAHCGALLKYRRVYARVRPEVGDTIWQQTRPDETVGIGGQLLAGVLGYLQRGTVRPRKQAADEVVQYFSMPRGSMRWQSGKRAGA